jgi:NADH:ubiquinone oxidoreductase subunit 6 (subunit J)
MEFAAFVVLSILAVASALVVVIHKNPVISAVALAFNLMSIAGFYLLLSAQFIALLQILVYAGAIMVLIMFVVMLLNLQEEQRLAISRGLIQRTLAIVVAALFVILMGRLMLEHGPTSMTAVTAGFGSVEALGMTLFSTFFYPFEVISLLLIAAMVGAVLLAKRSV